MQRSVAHSPIQSSTSAVIAELNSVSAPPQSMRWQGLSLRLKATLLAVAMSTLPVLVVGTTAFLSVSQASRAELEKRDKQLASEVQNHVYQYMWERIGDIQVMANLEIFTESQRRQTASVEDKSKALEQFLKAYPLYDSIAVFNLNGDPIGVAQDKDLPPLKNHSDRGYIKDAISTKGPVLSQPQISATSGVFSVYTAAPVRDKDTGEIIATVRARIPVNKLSESVPALKSQSDSFYYLINASGDVFYGPEGEYISRSQSNGTSATGNEPTYAEKQLEAIFPGIEAFTKAKQAGSMVVSRPAGKSEQFVTYVPPAQLQGLPDLKWSVALATDSSIAFAAQRQQLLVLLIGMGATVIIVSILAAYITNRAVRPILVSAKAVEQIGQGKLDTRIAVTGEDELATLGHNINQMANQLQTLLKTLNQNETQLKEQNMVLSELSRHEALIQGNSKAAASSFTEATAKTLGIERVSIWLYNTERSGLTCLDRYDLEAHHHSEGTNLYASQLPEYFQTLQYNPFISVQEMNAHPATQELLSAQVVPATTTAFLSIPIRIADRTVGLIQCERLRVAHVWQADEETFVTGVANLVSIVLESEFLQEEVSHLLDVVSDMEEGDLTTIARVSDRATGLVADTFNRLIERLSHVLNQVLHASHQVSDAADQQKMLASTVAMNAEQQAEAVNQVLDLTEQVEQAAQGAAEQATVSNESLKTVASTVVLGQSAIEALMQGIAVLQEGTDRIMHRMKTLGEFVGLADQFVQNQSQIAFITQTLSLNASLVAARASEQRDPRQFVVVAREFDSIADQVNQLAQQTSEGLTSMEQRSNQIHTAVATVDADVQRMGELVKQFTTGVEQSQHVFDQIQTITTEAIHAGDSVGEFSQRIVGAAQTSAQVMREITELANKTVELTQRAAERSDQIDALAAQLLQTVQFFQLPAAPEASRIASAQPDQPAIADMTVTIPAETLSSN